MAVRFGNVLGSRGSVVSLFKRQIAQGEPLTVTHPEMVRYCMTIHEAVRLIIHAAAMGNGGKIFILDMARPVKILDLARDMIRLSGFEESEDVEIKFIGLRPGEKLSEKLLAEEEEANTTRHEDILVIRPEQIGEETLARGLEELRKLAIKGDSQAVKRKLQQLVPTYQPAE